MLFHFYNFYSCFCAVRFVQTDKRLLQSNWKPFRFQRDRFLKKVTQKLINWLYGFSAFSVFVQSHCSTMLDTIFLDDWHIIKVELKQLCFELENRNFQSFGGMILKSSSSINMWYFELLNKAALCVSLV